MMKVFLLGALLGLVYSQNINNEEMNRSSELCSQPPDTSDCGKTQDRWYYHPNLQACSKFIYKGCASESKNNFQTKEACEKTCVLVSGEESQEKIQVSELEQKPTQDEKQEKEIDTGDHLTVQHDNEQEFIFADRSEPILPQAEENAEVDLKETGESTFPISQSSDQSKGETDDDNEVLNFESSLQNKFNMADSEDMLTLQDIVQSPEMSVQDASDVLPINEQEESTEENFDPENENEKPAEVTNEDKNVDSEVNNEDKNVDVEAGKEDSEIIAFESNLENRFHMADSDDMLTLQDMVQNPEMDVQDIYDVFKPEDAEAFENEMTENKKDDNTQKTSQKQLENKNTESQIINFETNLENRYDMANSKDMFALQNIVQNPEMEVQDVTDINDTPSDSNEKTDEQSQNNIEEPKNIASESDEDEEIVRFEGELQTRFDMADSDDMLTLQDVLQNPEMDVQDVSDIPENQQNTDDHKEQGEDIVEKFGFFDQEMQQKPNLESYSEHLDHKIDTMQLNKQQLNVANDDDQVKLLPMKQHEDIINDEQPQEQSTDVNGIIDFAASFLKDEDENNYKELKEDIGQIRFDLDDIKEEPQQQANDESSVEKTDEEMGLDTENMSYEDKMMLMSVLHLDNLRVQHPVGAKLPQLKPVERDFFKMENNDASPKRDFFSMLKINGVRKCCFLPKDPGPCKDKFVLQWHYDPVIKTCLPFHYGGCKGNKNRFDTIGECLRKCGEENPETAKASPKTSIFRIKPVISRFRSVVSNVFPNGHVMNIKDKMSQGQQKFFHKFVKNAIKHVNEISPVKLSSHLMASIEKKLNEKGSFHEMKPIVPLKSIMLKWPILRMVFDRRNKIIPRRIENKDDSLPQTVPKNEFIEPRNARPVNFEPFPKNLQEDRFFNGKEDNFEKQGWEQYRQMGQPRFMHMRNNWDRPMSREENMFPTFGEEDDQEFIENREGNFPRNRKRAWKNKESYGKKMFKNKGKNKKWSNRWDKYRKSDKHFSPSFKKSYKMMSHHEDNRHTISSDPNNKVNLIQVFVNKPNTKTSINPTSEYKMIKKPFSPEPQIRPPMPPPPPVSHNTPPQKAFFNEQHPHQVARNPPFPPRVGPHHPHPHSHIGNSHDHTHYHVHQPHPYHHHHPQQFLNMPPNFHFNQFPPKPWWSRFDRPIVEERFREEFGRRHEQINDGPVIEYHVDDEEPVEREDKENEGTEDVIVVTVPPGGSEDELHYACLLPVSIGMCKAIMERYYFNTATGECEKFAYGGCGGNANNFVTKDECLTTCSSKTSPVPLVSEKQEETTTLPEDTVIITSPVYVPDAGGIVEAKENLIEKQDLNSNTVKDAENRNDDLQVESSGGSKSDSVKVEPVSLFKSTNTEYIIVVAVMCFVGLAVIALVAVAIVNMSRKGNKATKKERVLEAVLTSHLERSNSLNGSITPRSNYYGQPPSEFGPPSISDVPKLHQNKEVFDEHL